MEKILVGNKSLTIKDDGSIWYRFFNYDSCAECNIFIKRPPSYFSLFWWQANKGANGLRIYLNGKNISKNCCL